MVEFLAFLTLVGLGFLLLIALPLLLIAGLFKLVFLVVMLPIRVVGAILGLFGALAVGVSKLFVVLLAVFFGVLAVAAGALLIPLLPVLLLVGLVWLVARAARPRQVVRPAA
jgi:hypothetical protein